MMLLFILSIYKAKNFNNDDVIPFLSEWIMSQSNFKVQKL